MKKTHSPTQHSGFKAEKIASDYLEKHGFKLITHNFVTRLGEIDLIMEDKTTLIFVEVRMRNKNPLVTSEESITRLKQKKIIRTALIYLQKYPTIKNCRIDVIAIHNNEINWIKDAFQVQ